MKQVILDSWQENEIINIKIIVNYENLHLFMPIYNLIE